MEPEGITDSRGNPQTIDRGSLTVVILTLNEEANLARCIGSVKGWANEFLILDSGSTDRTCSIAEESGARIVTHKTEGVFYISDQRNFILNSGLLRTEWTLFIDADETVTPELKTAVDDALQNRDYDAYSLTPKYLFWGKWLKRTQGYPNWHDRLLRNGAVHFCGGVWESFSDTSRRGYIREPYLHYANSTGFEGWLGRHFRYARHEAQKNIEHILGITEPTVETRRKKRLRKLAFKFWPLRPFVRFFVMFFLRLGFLEGWKAFLFCCHYFIYETMIVILTVEGLRKRKNLDL